METSIFFYFQRKFYFDSKSVEKARSRNPPERFRQLESLFIKKKFEEVKTSALSTFVQIADDEEFGDR